MPSRFFAIIPAAGTSTRMGTPKLLLPVAGTKMIEKTIRAWQGSRMYRIVVVIRPGDDELVRVCQSSGMVDVVVPPSAPPQMKDSVQCALRHLEVTYSPAPDDAWLMAPADMPHLSPQVMNTLLWEHDPQRPSILVPTIEGRRGHPVLFPWTLLPEVYQLAESEGLNVLQQRHPCREVPCDGPEIYGDAAFADIDTPDDYQRLK